MDAEGLHEREQAVRLATASNDPDAPIFTASLAQARERTAKKAK